MCNCVCTCVCVDAMQWSAISTQGSPPIPRSLHSAVLLKNRMFVFGGWVLLVPELVTRLLLWARGCMCGVDVKATRKCGITR